MRRCIDCGNEIAKNRLEANPEVLYCLQCQGFYDRPVLYSDAFAMVADVASPVQPGKPRRAYAEGQVPAR